MKPILATKELVIPEGVEVTLKSRRINVKGPRGQLFKDLSHIAADMFLIEEDGEKKLKVEIHFSSRKGLSSLRTVVSHVSNMIIGVTKGFRCEGSRSCLVFARQVAHTVACLELLPVITRRGIVFSIHCLPCLSNSFLVRAHEIGLRQNCVGLLVFSSMLVYIESMNQAVRCSRSTHRYVYVDSIKFRAVQI